MKEKTIRLDAAVVQVSNPVWNSHFLNSYLLQIPKVGEHNEWKDVQKKDTNNRPSETRNRRKRRKIKINKTSYFLSNSLNKSLNQWWKLKNTIKKRWRKIRKLLQEQERYQQKCFSLFLTYLFSLSYWFLL